MRVFVLFFFIYSAVACTSNLECGSADDSAPGLCENGICQCGVGYSGNQPIDPTSCSLVCAPPPVPDAVAFLKEPNVTVGASAGNLVMDINMDPYLNQIPATVAFLNPTNGSACALMAAQLGAGAWTQELLNGAGECDSRYLYAAPFAATVGQQCWNTLPASVESGAQYQVTFNQYQTQVEIIQKGQAPFGQAANKRQAKDVEITRAFRRDYTISVATQFRPNSAPFTLLASPPVGPTAVDDSASTPQNVPKTIVVLSNDLGGYQNQDGVNVPNALNPSSLSILVQPLHGSLAIVEGTVVYTPNNLYHGPDSFSYQICDAAALCDNALVSINVTPDPPVANADSAQVPFEDIVEVAVLTNDVAGVGGLVTLTIAENADPASGVCSVSGEGVAFQAATGFVGLANCTYQICDGSNPTVLCDTAIIVIDVGGAGPLAVPDAITLPQNSPSSAINVLSNDQDGGTNALNPASVSIIVAPISGRISGLNTSSGAVSYTPQTGFHGIATFTYQVCDVNPQGALCSSAVVTITISPNAPVANDDSISTAYASDVTIPILSNDVPGAQPIDISSVSVTSGPANGVFTINPVDGSIIYIPNTGFVGSDSFVYEVCDTSIPAPLCDTAVVTIVVNPIGGAGFQYRLVEIDYDILGEQIGAVVQTRTAISAKVQNVQFVPNGPSGSTGVSAVVSGPTTGASCDPASPAGFCDQFHEIKFSDDPCLVSDAELVLTAEFRCADGSDPSTCGYAVFQNSYTMNQLILTYDACPRVVQYGVDSAASFLRLHDDVPRAVPVSAPALQSSTLYGRCSVEPLAGSTFQSVTLTAMKVFQQDAAGPIDLGDQLNAAFMIMLSPLTSNNPTNPIWDFDLFMEPTVFLLANTYYLEATLDLTFENTGTLTRKLQIPLTRKMLARRGNAVLRRALSNPGAMDLVAVSGRAEESNNNQQQEGVFSNIFALRASEEEEVAEQPEASGSNTAMIAGIAGGIAGLVVVAAFIVVVVVVKKRRRTRDRSASDAPLKAPTEMAINDLV